MKRVLIAAAFVVLLLTIAVGRVIVGGELAIAESTEALLRGDARLAIEKARTAALFYAPGAPHVRVAYGRMIAIGRAAEERKDPELALAAYQAVRSSALSTRWLVVPHADDLAVAEDGIARLMAVAPRPPQKTLESKETFERSLREKMAERPPLQRGWAAASFLALIGMLMGLVIAIRRGTDESGRIDWAKARAGLVVLAAGFALWIAAAYFA
jgi:hypothetical protein